ncbi:MAG: phosphodiester glycosidase family protein [Cyanomargarita calcarea GSE-NOS-MK-12-04C]|uniref:Phosphodiester glycosidase family protein n=1 Tax=Cyanomargarita calcarea GSE-NOS-MK-12-04C TaxID=2839659 RepID=A0A951USA9_9CYAN|nr:phosphodiester glycosidase family protein [Cyanomargarita calcarea GSE-NOS-MK-12-04C]
MKKLLISAIQRNVCIATVVILITQIDNIQAKQAPEGFKLILEDTGVQVYKKDSGNQKLEYVTVVNTSSGKLSNLIGKVDGTPNVQVKKKLLTQFWQDAAKKNTPSRKVRVLVNGTFFSTNDNPTGIAFGLKVSSNIITYGYAIGKEYPGEIVTFTFNPIEGGANILPYDRSTFGAINSDVVGALAPNANKSATSFLPRTFVGVNGKYSVIIYSSNYARQIDAVNVLKRFGASGEAMLDGGGSTGLIVDGKALIPTNRPIPHALAVYEGL